MAARVAHALQVRHSQSELSMATYGMWLLGRFPVLQWAAMPSELRGFARRTGSGPAPDRSAARTKRTDQRLVRAVTGTERRERVCFLELEASAAARRPRHSATAMLTHCAARRPRPSGGLGAGEARRKHDHLVPFLCHVPPRTTSRGTAAPRPQLFDLQNQRQTSLNDRGRAIS